MKVQSEPFWDGFYTKPYPNGDVYEGNFLYGEKSGEGKFTYADKTYHEGEFRSDKFWAGSGTVKYDNESIYEGRFRGG